MRVFGYSELEKAPRGSVIALGFFDGVHKAHRDILYSAYSEAKRLGVPFGIFTFNSESNIKNGSKRLYTTKERLKIFEELSADFVALVSFSEVSSLSAESFVKSVLIDKLHTLVAFAGYNFRFGKCALGDSRLLSELLSRNGKRAVIIDEIRPNGEPISSSIVKGLIEEGRLKEANELLGAPYFFDGEVISGNSKGHSLGFPTVNTEIDEVRIIPRLGVYRSLVLAEGVLYNAVTNVGKCPTLGERDVHLETHIIDFSGDLYGKKITVYLLEFLREEKSFEDKNQLIMQINIDKNTTIKKNGEEKWQELGLK